jgi:hypothetical protein
VTGFTSSALARGASRAVTADTARVARTYDRMRLRHRGEPAEQIAPYIKAAWGRIGHQLSDTEAMTIATSVSTGTALKTQIAATRTL